MPVLQHDEMIPLTGLATALWDLTGQEPPTYRRLHLMVLDGSIPAEQVNRRWQIKPTDLRGIAEMLGMAVPAPRVRGRTWPSSHAGRRRTSPAAA